MASLKIGQCQGVDLGAEPPLQANQRLAECAAACAMGLCVGATVSQVQRGQYGVQRTEILPGDQDNLAIETQGGPEKHEVTGWVLLSPLSKEDAGEYECHTSNSQGQASTSEKITVVDTVHEIPVKKVCNQSHSHSKQ
ncbi:Insulin-like growth factor-binding protein 7 [Sciurus carolinensis]|uniref:Insulin-like growth factor-binding protein 7 n=1 Tax=Sciurus carolinensis TaxID=30640 RepID=A0AA41T886_SCICA|nr:Insulin-like growth factor-binding protein 7 [Sciurus carolinensis]